MKKDPSIILFDDLRNQKGYIQLDINSMRHWISYVEKGNPDDPSLDNDDVEKMTSKDFMPYFEPLTFVGWQRYERPTTKYPAGRQIVSALRKHASNQFIFKVEDPSMEPSLVPKHWGLGDLRGFLGKDKKINSSKFKDLHEQKEARLTPTKEALEIARSELKKFPLDATEIDIIVLAQSRKSQEKKGWKVIPPEIGLYKNLQSLSLVSHMFAEVPAEIGKLKDLTYLDLNGNRLTTLPPEIGNLKNLKTLDLDYNEHLISLPSEIGQCENLAYLSLKNCLNLKGLPENIKNCKKLKDINLQYCRNRKEIAEQVREWLPGCKVDSLP